MSFTRLILICHLFRLMSRSNYGKAMDHPETTPGSVRQARERAEAELPFSRNVYRNPNERARIPSNSSKLRKGKSFRANDAKNNPAISRPTQVPQWPLPSNMQAINQHATIEQSYQVPLGRPLQAPRRPPRPSRIPSMVNQGRLQEPTPLFSAPVRTHPNPVIDMNKSTRKLGTNSESPILQSNAYTNKGTIQGPPQAHRRRGSSFYSQPSVASPIIEESPLSRSHGSFASSAAMPEAWGVGMRNNKTETFYEDSVTERSRDSLYSEYGDESRLVPSGPTDLSISLETTAVGSQQTSKTSVEPPSHHSNKPRRSSVLQSLGGIMDRSRGANSPIPFKNIASRRPPKLNIEAVKTAESRGSLTSLPDLIRRATELAAMMDKGKRPTSRLDNLTDLLNEKEDGTGGKGRAITGKLQAHNWQKLETGSSALIQTEEDRRRSGLSDMLAAFPPPVHTPVGNGPQSSWMQAESKLDDLTKIPASQQKRLCCGLPMWAFILLIIFLLCATAAAVVIPLEFFVFKNLGQHGDKIPSLESCQRKLICSNGGTNILSQSTCSCICTGGFTGADCKKAGSVGCTMTDLVSPDGGTEINNVTLGMAIPRLIAEANANFSVPLSGTSILAKFNSGDISCIAQNSVVTFNGQSTRVAEQPPKAEESSDIFVHARKRRIGRHSHATRMVYKHLYLPAQRAGELQAASEGTTSSTGRTTHIRAETPFTVSQKVLDFARVVVLYILQEQDLDAAQQAQTSLQDFFTKSANPNRQDDPGTMEEPTSVSIGQDKSVNLVKFFVNIGSV